MKLLNNKFVSNISSGKGPAVYLDGMSHQKDKCCAAILNLALIIITFFAYIVTRLMEMELPNSYIYLLCSFDPFLVFFQHNYYLFTQNMQKYIQLITRVWAICPFCLTTGAAQEYSLKFHRNVHLSTWMTRSHSSLYKRRTNIMTRFSYSKGK